MGSSLHGSTGPGRSLLQRRLPMGSQPSPGIHLLRRGFLHRLQVDICSTMDLHGLQRDSLPHHGLHHELQGKDLCFSISSTSSPSFFTDLAVCRVASFTSSHSSLLTVISAQFFFLLLLNYVITEALPPSLIGLALASGRPIFEPASTGFIRHGGSSQLLTEATPIAPSLSKPCHGNP